MVMPKFRDAGQLDARPLIWTRVYRADEVPIVTPSPLDHPGHARSAAEALEAKPWAERVLAAHNFPRVDWLQLLAWAWSDGDLYWAVLPADSGTLIFEGGREEDPAIEGLSRGGLGFLDAVSPMANLQAEAWRPRTDRAARLWPLYSEPDLALTIFDAHSIARPAEVRFDMGLSELPRRAAEREQGGEAHRAAGRAWVEASNDERQRAARNQYYQSVTGYNDAPDAPHRRWIKADVNLLRQLDSYVTDYLAKYRSEHSPIMKHGVGVMRARQKGTANSAAKAAKRTRLLDEKMAPWIGSLIPKLAKDGAQVSRDDLAAEIRASWPEAGFAIEPTFDDPPTDGFRQAVKFELGTLVRTVLPRMEAAGLIARPRVRAGRKRRSIIR